MQRAELSCAAGSCNQHGHPTPPTLPSTLPAARMPRWDPSRARTLQLDISYTRRGGPDAASEGRRRRQRPQVGGWGFSWEVAIAVLEVV